MQRRIMFWVAVTLLLSVAVRSAWAQEEGPGPLEGRSEMALSASLMGVENTDPSWSLSGSYGKYVTNAGQWCGVVLASGAGGDVMIGLTAGYKHHFVSEKPKMTLPYVGCSVGLWTSSALDSTAWLAGVTIGEKFFLAADRGVFLEGCYNRTSGDGTAGMWTLQIGLFQQM